MYEFLLDNIQKPHKMIETVLNFSKKFSWLDVFIFVCALGDFLVLSAFVLRQIARYLPYHTSGNASKNHPKSSHDKFKTASKNAGSGRKFIMFLF